MLIANFFINIVVTFRMFLIDEFGWNWMSVYVFYDVIFNVCEWCGVWLRLPVLSYSDSISY